MVPCSAEQSITTTKRFNTSKSISIRDGGNSNLGVIILSSQNHVYAVIISWIIYPSTLVKKFK